MRSVKNFELQYDFAKFYRLTQKKSKILVYFRHKSKGRVDGQNVENPGQIFDIFGQFEAYYDHS